MEQLVKYIAQSLVDKPAEVKVVSHSRDRDVIIELSVSPDDMGKVIGKQGRIAKAIRKIVKAASTKDNVNYIVEIV